MAAFPVTAAAATAVSVASNEATVRLSKLPYPYLFSHAFVPFSIIFKGVKQSRAVPHPRHS